MASNSAEETQSDNLSDIWVLASQYSLPNPEFCDPVPSTVEIPHKPGMWDMESEVPESDEEMRTMRVSLVRAVLTDIQLVIQRNLARIPTPSPKKISSAQRKKPVPKSRANEKLRADALMDFNKKRISEAVEMADLYKRYFEETRDKIEALEARAEECRQGYRKYIAKLVRLRTQEARLWDYMAKDELL